MIYNYLYDYQKHIVDNLKRYDSTALFTDTGTGKSYMSIGLYQEKWKEKKVNKCLVICLLGKIDEWVADFKKWQPFDRVLVLDGKKDTMKKYRAGEFEVAVVNFEKTWRLPDLLTYTDNHTMIIIDESHKIKSSKTKQGEFISLLGAKTPYKLILTATPMGNGYIDIYNQFYFLGLIGMSFKTFEDNFVNYSLTYIPGMKPFKTVAGYKNTDVLDQLVQKYCAFYERKVDDELVPSEIEVELPLDKEFNKLNRDRVYKDIVLNNVSAKRLALKSLCSGSIMGKPIINDSEGETKVYQVNRHKIEWVKTFLETFNDRVVIFYQYKHQCEQLYNEIAKTKRPVARYNADYKEKDIFLDNKDCVLLVQYKSGGTGIDWLKQSYVGIFYCLPDSYIEFVQSKGRINRNGQKKKPLFYILLAKGSNSVDHLNYEALKNNQDFNDEWFERVFGN